MGMSDIQQRAWKSVLGYGDTVKGPWECRGVVIDVSDADIDLGAAVHRRGAGVGLDDEKGVGERLVVQRLPSGNDASLSIHREQALGVT